MKKAILLIIDGLGDLPTPKTALQMAKKPNLDKLAKNGITGLMSSLGRSVVPGSDTSHLQIFGYAPDDCYCGRGPLEALGLGIPLEKGDVAFRANFATVQNGKITDRRAGRISTEFASILSGHMPERIEDVQVIFKNSVEHRGALVLKGPGLSPAITETDPHKLSEIPECKPMDKSPEAQKTARIVNSFTRMAIGRLTELKENKERIREGLKPANCILLRGPGSFLPVESIYEKHGVKSACISGGALYRGVARYVGMDIFMVPGATGDKKTNLKTKVHAVKKALETHDLVFLHIKATDSFGHDGDLKGKTEMISRIDREVIAELAKTNTYLVITGDHSTPCARKAHSGHEVPILVYGKDERADKVSKFDEISCMDGGLGHIEGKDIMPLILNLIEKAKKEGS